MAELINDGRPFLRRDAHDVGLTPRELARALDEKRVREVLTYVYADVNVADTRAFRLEAAQLVAPREAVVCDSLAAWLFHVDTFKPSERHRLSPTFVVPHGTTRSEIEGVDC